MYTPIHACRICGNTHLVKVLDLGEQTLTGVFPKTPDQAITRGPLHLLKCTGSDDCCGLLQLAHSYDLGEMYGENYGYRSGLNKSMVEHLHAKVARIRSLIALQPGDMVIDIGSNDGTTLSAYPADGITRVGIDPTAEKFRQYYPADVNVIPDFFSARLVQERFGERKARVVTSFSMFYDLERPMDFVREVASVLHAEGIWVFEQSYMPLMLDRNSYDTACHEHLEYYALKQIQWMAQRCGLKIVDVEFNDVNGGSFSITAAHQGSQLPESPEVARILQQEAELGLDTEAPYRAFAERVARSRTDVRAFLEQAKAQGKKVGILGASTKGNVLLQYCSITAADVVAVGEVNPDKFGSFTPGSLIPIIDEAQLLAQQPDYLLVLPWHFRPFFEKRFGQLTSTLVFPLPELEIAGQ